VANTLELFRQGTVGFIVWLGHRANAPPITEIRKYAPAKAMSVEQLSTA
jgi:hypothetical protein